MTLCLSVSVCVGVCLLQVGVLSKRMDESRWVFCMGAFFDLSYTVIKKFSYLQKNGTSLWNYTLNSGLRKFRHSASIVEARYQLSSRKVDAQSAINWAVVGQLS